MTEPSIIRGRCRVTRRRTPATSRWDRPWVAPPSDGTPGSRSGRSLPARAAIARVPLPTRRCCAGRGAAVALTIGTSSTNPVGPLLLTAGGLALGATLLVAARDHRSPGLAVAGASILAGITLAAGYALSMRFGFPWLTVDAMERTHGVLNAIGFATVGVAAWTAVDGTTPHRDDEELACASR